MTVLKKIKLKKLKKYHVFCVYKKNDKIKSQFKINIKIKNENRIGKDVYI